MKRTKFLQFALFILISTVMLLLPAEASADTWVDKTQNYSVTLSGTSKFSIKCPVYDQDGADCWVTNGNLKIVVKGSTYTVFHWSSDGNVDSDSEDIPVHFKTEVGGNIAVTQGNSTSHFTLTSSMGDVVRQVYENSDGDTYSIYAVWTVPLDWRGEEVKLTWDVERDGNARSKEKVSGLSDFTVTIPAAEAVVYPQITTATLSYSEAGKIEIPWYIAKDAITDIKYKYKDANGTEHTVTMDNRSNNGIIYVDATEVHNDFHIVASYKDKDDNPITEKSSTSLNLAMLHAPISLTATPQGDHKAKVRLAWSIEYQNVEDVVPMDFFEVQRSLTGREEDFTSIGTVPFTPKSLSYTYIDSLLISALSGARLKNGGTLDSLTYRIRRTATQTWGWEQNTAAQYASCIVDDLHLLRVAGYTAQWEDSLAYTARVNWTYADEYNAVWDDRAQMAIFTTMYNREGELIDSVEYILTAQERSQQQKIISVARTCVDYKIEFRTKRLSSPIGQWKDIKPFVIPIHTADDWNAFCDSVEAGGIKAVHARLYNDITVSRIAGGLNKPYSGVFDGNGHTITASINYDEDYVGLFRNVKDATFRNLHVAGNITCSAMYASGLVGKVEDGKVLIENCRMSATINSTTHGIAACGGFIGRMFSAQATIRNCVFNGSFEGKNSYAHSGFVGSNDDGTLQIENCLFDPIHLGTRFDGCKTWARGKAPTLINSYATIEYDGNTLIIATEADWIRFAEMVETAAGKYDVNAILTADISTDTIVGWNATAPYRGTFDGRGHTLHVNYDQNVNSAYAADYIAPFRMVEDCTIKNLHVTGTVVGGKWSSGLIGTVMADSHYQINIDNVWVAVNVTSTNNSVAGIIGHANSAILSITDCRFDGTLNTNNSSYFTYGGAIVAMGDNYDWTTDNKCWTMHRVYENGTYNNILYAAMGHYWEDGTTYGWGNNDQSTNCISAHNWDKMLNDTYRNQTDQDTVVQRMNAEVPGSWQLVDGKAVPVMDTIATGDLASEKLLKLLGSGWKIERGRVVPDVRSSFDPAADLPVPVLPTFYHKANGVISTEIKTVTRQSSVYLAWDTDGRPIDYFTVYRRVKNSPDTTWTVVITGIDKTSYEDTSVLPLEDYEYRVCATNDCEGEIHSWTAIYDGACEHSGKVEGYVRFSDGSGAAGITVTIEPQDSAHRLMPGTTFTVTTDQDGHFIAKDIPYLGGKSVTYTVTPTSQAIHLENGSAAVTFDSLSNYRVLSDFIITNGLSFSAVVMYEGTSIPVKGAHFRVNDSIIYNRRGEVVETDFEGKANFFVLAGTSNKIRVEMDGHTFTKGGYYKSPQGVVLTDKVTNVYFYDSTLVCLTGRVVGGKDQGELPLGNNLSRNNLGEDLTMVLTLEGDNTSWLVFDNTDPLITQRNKTFPHPVGTGHQTTAEVFRKRMVVKPDSATGEYRLMLPPVRWKVTQVYCEGYPTLFQDGMVNEVIDLTSALTADTIRYSGTYTDVDGRTIDNPVAVYNAVYNRIYHSPVEITYRQLVYDGFDYFGDLYYYCSTLGGYSEQVPLVYHDSIGVDSSGKTILGDTTRYTFGYPVFSLERRYPIQISVVERYPWNGVAGSLNEDIVHIGGGKVTIHNGFANGVNHEIIQLDENGQAVYNLKAEQTTRLLTGNDALRTVTMTLEQDGTTYEAKPLQGYILNLFATTGAQDAISVGQPLLIDILRDPPGGSSTATISKGSTLKYDYTVDMAFEAGVSLQFGVGTKMDSYSGTVAAPVEYGIINTVSNHDIINLDIITSGNGKKGYSYTMKVNEDITTSSEPTMVGGDADVYIGVVQNMLVSPVSSIRAIPDSLYSLMSARLSGTSTLYSDSASNSMTGTITTPYGSLVHIAEGVSGGKKYHLVRDESLAYGPQITSRFIHSQKHIVTQILPQLAQDIFAMLHTGAREQAQAEANATKKPVYWVENLPSDTAAFEYEMIKPAGDGKYRDELKEKLNVLGAWINMIGENEYEKMTAYDMVANYDLDGGSKFTHGETFESEYTQSQCLVYPFTTADYFGTDGDNRWDRLAAAAGVILSQPFLKTLLNMIPTAGETTAYRSGNDPAKINRIELDFFGATFQFGITPVVSYSSTGTYGSGYGYSRQESFTISMDKKSHLNFDVYHVRTATTDTTGTRSISESEVFFNANYNQWSDIVASHIRQGITTEGISYSAISAPRGYVYRTRGGATCNPWEDERNTLVYRPGTTVDQRTKKIVNPKIWLDRQSVSGVRIDQPAVFKVYMANDSEQPEAVSGALCLIDLYLVTSSNPHGARIFIESSPLNGNGMEFIIKPGEVTTTTMYVYAGEGFDYDSLQLMFAPASDWEHVSDLVSFDVHYLREAGPVNISNPGNKWVMNCDAGYDNDRGWFLPIVIDGFNKHQHNFDHIELQYKETNRGEEYWTNLCSFYADSTLMANASGVKKLIPENGNITHKFYGDGPIIEKGYDLRAVLFCRDGNSFLTSSSTVLSGVKDTRRPQLFGNPEPKNAIIGIGDNIIFNFSEDIDYNYLSQITNFEVKGEVNNANVAEAVSVLFSGNSSVETEAKRNLSYKDFTIDMMICPEATGTDMPLFSHGTNGSKLQLWLTSDSILRAVIGDSVYTARKAINTGGFTQIALAMRHPAGSNKGLLTLYNGGLILDTFRIYESYNGVGPLIFGRTNETNRTRSTYYHGRMMEARLWYRALTGGQLGTTYGNRRLTGYEVGLVDYYPMNEGTGTYALDHAQGANARLIDAGWMVPRGWSLHTDGQAVRLDENALNRTDEQDYTLMFWFQTDEHGRGVVLGNTGITDDTDPNHFCIGFDGAELVYRSAEQVHQLGSGYDDNTWHHFAMTVNRAHNIANIYIDHALRVSFASDQLGGISGGVPAIGDAENGFTGNIDELCFFSQALPLSLIKRFATKSPAGDEAGLLTYFSFDRQQRQKDNDIELVPYPYSRRIYLDDKLQVVYELDPVTKEPTTTPKRDYLFVDSVAVIMSHLVNSTAAPVAPAEELKNISFSYAGKNNQVLVNINELASRINRRNLYVTLRDVEDKNGNAMASPATAVYFVNNSALRWIDKQMETTGSYGYEDKIYLEFENIDATDHTYTIENCPKWLTLDTYTDVISAQNKVTITGIVNKGLNVGSYDEVIYLTDENGVSEPLYFMLTVEGEQPEWADGIEHELLQYSMNIIGRVYVHDEIDIDNRDIIGAFDRDGKCHGFANIHYTTMTGESNLYLTVYDNHTSGTNLYFKLWQYSTGREMMLTMPTEGSSVRDVLAFRNGTIIGTDEPVRFEASDKYIQTFNLKEGWNWISFNVTNDKLLNLHNLLESLPWKDGDVLTDMNSTTTFIYKGGFWIASSGNVTDEITPKKAYAVKVQAETRFPIAGNIIQNVDMRTITLKNGWNGIGYTPMHNLPVETALSDYYDKALPGDVIKSHDEFAYFTNVGGVGRWKGSLEYMKPGEGYMLLRKAQNETNFVYPFYEPNSTFIDEWSYSTVRSSAPARRNTMSVSAVVDGISLMEGDQLVALANGERIGEAGAKDNVFYLTISNDVQSGIRFAIERDGEILDTTDEQMTYTPNAVVGAPDNPAVISFRTGGIDNGNVDEDDCGCGIRGWYTPLGILLPDEPTVPGVYIHNCKKEIIK
ncbi:MAG: hypothetical protein IJS13_04955 [Paludibacteraceae bacterium]|nr:hypothetical protein [Paludibacteraceae bacterium]